jgi:predicted RNase H-like HicB family nuclease
MRRFVVVLEGDPHDGVWIAHVPALNHLSTYGETREEALAHTREAILGYLEAASKTGLPVPSGDVQLELLQVEVPAP